MLHNSNVGEATLKYAHIKLVLRNKFMLPLTLSPPVYTFDMPMIMKYVIIPTIM